MQVVLDTSAWINVSTRALVSQLSERAAQLQTRLAVPKEVLGEILAQDDHERAWTHIQTMASVDERSKVFLSAGFGALHDLECERAALKRHRPPRAQPGVPLTAMPWTPTMDRREATLLTQCFRDKARFDVEAASLQANATEHLDVQKTWALDKRARSVGMTLGEKLDPAGFRDMILTGYPARLAAAHFLEELLPRRAWRERALRQPHMFSTTLLWALCQELSGWGILQLAYVQGQSSGWRTSRRTHGSTTRSRRPPRTQTGS
jgi:hypothetical protein